jgi:lipoyl(octanoyl) transferase
MRYVNINPNIYKVGIDMDSMPYCRHIDFDQIDYETAWQLQEKTVSGRINGTLSGDVIFFLEHPPVFTMGRRGGQKNLLVSETFLRTNDVSMHHVERGGDITYHGPGQLVVYPILKLSSLKLGVLDFVEQIEEVMIRTAADYNITATRKDINRGAWVGDKKIGSIGIAVRKGVTFHGMALNVDMDLTPFSWITPCGLKNVEVTRISDETTSPVSMPHIKKSVQKHWQTVFNVKLLPMALSDMSDFIQNTDQ